MPEQSCKETCHFQEVCQLQAQIQNSQGVIGDLELRLQKGQSLQDEIRNELNVSKQKIVVEEREKNVLREEILASKHSSEVLSSITIKRPAVFHV
jgi:hypothetical protein